MLTKQELENHIVNHWSKDVQWRKADIPDGWAQIVKNLVDELDTQYTGQYSIVQIKTKFGGLRFYVEENVPETDAQAFHDKISKTEHAAYNTCMVCGKEGIYRTRRYRVLCDLHVTDKD